MCSNDKNQKERPNFSMSTFSFCCGQALHIVFYLDWRDIIKGGYHVQSLCCSSSRTLLITPVGVFNLNLSDTTANGESVMIVQGQCWLSLAPKAPSWTSSALELSWQIHWPQLVHSFCTRRHPKLWKFMFIVSEWLDPVCSLTLKDACQY